MESLLTGYILFDGDFVAMWLRVHISRNHFFSVRVRSARPFFATSNQVGFFSSHSFVERKAAKRDKKITIEVFFRQSLKEKL